MTWRAISARPCLRENICSVVVSAAAILLLQSSQVIEVSVSAVWVLRAVE
jgi:hypothetical protein